MSYDQCGTELACLNCDANCGENCMSLEVLQSNELVDELKEQERKLKSEKPLKKLSAEIFQNNADLHYEARQLRVTMPDQTRRVINAVFEHVDDQSAPIPSLSVTPAPSLQSNLLSLTSFAAQKPLPVSPKPTRRYSQSQKDADCLSQDSNVHKADILQVFQKSAVVSNSLLLQRKPGGLSSQSSNTISLNSHKKEESRAILPDQSIFGKMVGSGKQNSFFSSFTPRSDTTATSLSLHSDKETEQNNHILPTTNKSLSGRKCPSQSEIDGALATDSKSSGFGLLARTRQFGAWLSTAVDGEKVEVTKKDVNVFAPTTF